MYGTTIQYAHRNSTPAKYSAGLVGLVGFIALLTLLLVASATAASNSAARSVAMGGAHMGLASGVDAARFNPANLGLSDHRKAGLELAGFGASVVNNAFTLSDYNKYTGAFLTTADKQDILSKIPDEGLKLSANVEASALAFSAGSFALAVTGIGVADINLSKDIFELVLNGNTFADTISVDGSYSDAVSYAAAGLSFGLPIYSSGSRQLSVGATAKYLRGLAVEQVVELRGMAATYETGFAGSGELIAQTATGGAGYALDLGAALKLNNNYTLGVKVENLVSRLSWNRETEEHGYIFSFDTMTVDNMGDDYVVSEDYTREIAPFHTSLPQVLTAGLANTSGKFVWAVDWQQGFKKKAGASTKPRLSAGVEWSLISLLPLRAGYAVGGDQTAQFSFGSGLHLWAFYLDAAAVTGSSISGYSSKGLNLAVTTGLYF